MKKLFLILSLAIFTQYANSQSMGIGTNTTPDPSAILDVNGTKGFLPPRMTNVQRGAIGSPSVGLMVFQTNTSLIAPASSAGLYVNDASGWKRIATSDEINSGGGSSSWTVSGVNQYSNLTGNVGIGINLPTSKLHVVGNLLVESGDISINDAFGTLYFKNAGLTRASLQLGSSSNYDITLGTAATYNTTGKIKFNIQGNTKMAIDTDGNVGIGTTIPVGKLDVRGSVAAEGLFKLNNSADNQDWFITNAGGNNGINFIGGAAVRLKLNWDGNVGIGTNTPIDKLEVYDGNITQNNTNGTFRLQANSVDKGFMQLNGNDVRLGTYSTNDLGNLILRVNGTDRLTISAAGTTSVNGNQSIAGTTTIGGKLTVNEGFEAVKINGDNPAINFFEAGIQRGYIWMIDNDMNIGNSQANSRINMSTSQVTIGTSIATPGTYKLGVGGRIICEELKVKLQSNGWPDYVFGENYKLKSLEEVENFIKINNHLPNIPSAQVIDKEGLEVGEMQRRMMEKIEELTLYIIDLKKEVNALKAKK